MLLLCLAATAGSLCAQGPILRERWTFAELEAMRRILLDECKGKDPAVLREVTRELLPEPDGETFAPVLRSLARLRGVEPDAAFLFRGTLRAVARPEVVDPDGEVAECRDLNATYYLPYLLDDPGAVRIEVTVEDATGEEVWRGTVRDDTAVDDLLHYLPTCRVPGAELPDGSYILRSRVYLDGEPPRPGDPETACAFSVLRGFQARAEDLLLRRGPALQAEGLDPLPLAVLRGVVAQVDRVYRSEPFEGRSQPLRDLARAERVVENLGKGRPPLLGLEGRVNLALPAGPDGEIASLALRLPADGDPRPLVLFLPGGPSYDHRERRPASPRSTAPGWWADVLEDRDFDAARRWHWAVMESPGRVANSSVALRTVLEALGEIFAIADGSICVVAERQGAWVASQGQSFPKPGDTPIAGLVLALGGTNLSPEAVEKNRLEVLVLSSEGHPASAGLERLAERVDSGHLRVLDGAARPWPLVVGLSLPEIDVFLERLFRDR